MSMYDPDKPSAFMSYQKLEDAILCPPPFKKWATTLLLYEKWGGGGPSIEMSPRIHAYDSHSSTFFCVRAR